MNRRTRRAAVATAALAATGRAGWQLLSRYDAAAVRRDPAHVALTAPVLAARPLAVRSADGTRLNVQVSGPDEAPTVVLSHGWTCSVDFWRPQQRTLAGELRLVSYDQRGHGASAAGPDRTYGPDRLADDLAAVLQATIPAGRPAVLVGHSMGAMAIVAWAGRYPDQVPRFAAAALLASTGLSDLAGAGRVLPLPRHWARVHAVAGRGLLTAALPLGRPGPISHRALRYVTMSPAASPAQVAFCERIVLACPPRARAGWGLALHSLDLWESLPALVVPTAVLVGAADRMTPPALARRLAAALPLADGLVELPGVGHMSTVEAPDAVADEVRRLVRTYAGSAA